MATSGISSSTSTPLFQATPESSAQQAVLDQLTTTSQSSTDDTVSINGLTNQLSTNLSVFAQQVLDKLQQSIGDQIPGGISSLKVEDHTPEKTAQAIVDGVSQLFSVFAQQNKDLSGDALVSKFLETVKGGIEAGYGQADKILGDAGAYDLPGIRDGINETKKLVEEKLAALEEKLRGKDSSAASGSGTVAATSTSSTTTTASVSVTTVA